MPTPPPLMEKSSLPENDDISEDGYIPHTPPPERKKNSITMSDINNSPSGSRSEVSTPASSP